MAEDTLRILIFGAHPDDAEFHAGGLACIYRRLGHTVKMVSLTNGDAGHHQLRGAELAEIRRAEAARSAAVIGAVSEVWDNHDGQLLPTLELRSHVIRAIRTFQPDLVLTHRVNDYHPDHRAVGQVVQDASYMVTVPPVVPEVPHLRRDPVVAFLPDNFTKPTPLEGHVVVDTGDCVDTVVEMLACHESQVFQWLPYNRRIEDQVPEDPAGRTAWLKEWYLGRVRPRTERYRQRLIATYGPQRGAEIQEAEVFEISEYASPLDDEARRRLFPFVPEAGTG